MDKLIKNAKNLKSVINDLISETDWFVNYLFPFLEATTDKERNQKLTESFSSPIGSLILTNTMNCLGKSEIQNKINDLQVFFKEVLQTALCECQKSNKKMIARITKNLSIKHNACWQGLGNCKIEKKITKNITNRDKGLTEIENFERRAISNLTKLFESYYDDNGQLCKGYGFEKVKLCKECKKPFVRRRKDQEYCSKKCGGIARVKRFREKKK